MCRVLANAVLLCCLALTAAAPASAKGDNEYYEEALVAYDLKEYPEALIHLKNTLEADPDHIPARVLLAKLYFNMGDIYGAEKESSQALLLGADINLVLPIYGSSLVLQRKIDELFEIEGSYGDLTAESKFEWALLKGQGHLAKGEVELAVAEYEKALAIDPVSVRACNTLAWAYAGTDRMEEATALLERSLALDPDNEKTWRLKGQLASRQGNNDLAQESFETSLELDPKDPLVLRSLARVHMLKGDYAGLRRLLDLILEASPDDPAATLLTAMMIMSREGDEELGAKMLKELSIKLSNLEDAGYQSYENTLFIRASADYIQRNDESARTLLNTYLKKQGHDLSAIRMLTDVYLRNGERTRAAELLSTRREVVIRDFSLALQLIYLYLDQNNILGAQETLAELKRLAPGHPRVLMLEAEYLSARGQAEGALALLNGQSYGEDEPLDFALLRGKLELELKQYQAAVSSVKGLEKLFPREIRVNNFAAVTFLRLGKPELARPYIETALQLDAKNLNARFNQAALMKSLGEVDSASEIVNGILADRPEHVSSILLMASILRQQKQYDNAIEWSRKVLNYAPVSTKPGELQLAIYEDTGNWKKALEVALQLNKQDRLNTEYMVRLAEVYIELKQYDSAQRPLHKLFTLWEKDPGDLRRLARLQVRSRNLEAARKSLETALQQDMRSFEIRLDLARLALAEGKLNESAESVAALRRETGERTRLAMLQGQIELARRKPGQALLEFTKAYELDNDNTAALLKIYQLSLRGTGGQELSELIESSLKTGPQPAWKIRLLADSYLAQGKNDQAAHHYETLLTIPSLSDNAAVLNNLANIYAREDLDKALATAMRGMDAEGKNSWALLDTIGWILTQQKSYQQALRYLREAYTMNSTHPEIRYHLGVTLLALGRKTEAEEELRAAMVLDSDFPDRPEVARLVSSISD